MHFRLVLTGWRSGGDSGAFAKPPLWGLRKGQTIMADVLGIWVLVALLGAGWLIFTA